ncbi:MAG: hypothetical protein HY925_00935 [Elusimicrobia bacterium]|nr:hypothetical protein [Elusimicrobiota bacterium]
MRSIALLALACVLARPGLADEAEAPDYFNANIGIQISATRKGTKISGTLFAVNGTQANVTLHDPTGQVALIANFLPGADPNNRGIIDAQFQVSSPDAAKLDFNVQGEVKFVDGKEKVVMETGGGNKLALTLWIQREP